MVVALLRSTDYIAQFLKDSTPIEVTLLKSIDDKLEQSLKACYPILIHVLGIFTEVKRLQEIKHAVGISVTSPKLVIVVILAELNALGYKVLRFGAFTVVIALP
jgi:hypothetical protein